LLVTAVKIAEQQELKQPLNCATTDTKSILEPLVNATNAFMETLEEQHTVCECDFLSFAKKKRIPANGALQTNVCIVA
jgi:glucose-6-phosphate isomerase